MIVLKDVAKDTDLFIKNDCFEDVAKCFEDVAKYTDLLLWVRCV